MVQRAVSAMVGIITLLAALFTAPLFHSHEEVEHGHHVSTVHAHFVEENESDTHSELEIEAAHSHHDARSIDFFTFHKGPTGFELAIDIAEAIEIPLPPEQPEIVLTAEAQAHGPPALPPLLPRSPPAS